MCVSVIALSFQVLSGSRSMINCSRQSISYFLGHRCYYTSNIMLGEHLRPHYRNTLHKVLRSLHSRQRTYSTAKTVTSSDHVPSTLTKSQAKELATKLTSKEREVLITALQECKSQEDKAGYEGQLAAFRWRSKFGRPSKIPSLGDVDPTGSYCPVPEDWLLQKYVEIVPEPTTKDCILVALANAIPFIGFGFLDNFIMIVAGDQIEMILNRKFPISTMAAAALGNTVSDIIGIGSVQYVELLAQKVGFKQPKLTPIQLNLRKTRLAANMGRVIGVTVGCLIGMSPIPLVALFHKFTQS